LFAAKARYVKSDLINSIVYTILFWYNTQVTLFENQSNFPDKTQIGNIYKYTQSILEKKSNQPISNDASDLFICYYFDFLFVITLL